MPWTIASKNQVEINFIKDVQNLYAEDYKKVLREIKIKIDGKISYVYGLKSLILFRQQYSPN